jgi:hypothetical protein
MLRGTTRNALIIRGFRWESSRVYRTDFRASGDTSTTSYNLMLTESSDVRLDLACADEERVASAIHGALLSLGMAPLQPTGTAARGR